MSDVSIQDLACDQPSSAVHSADMTTRGARIKRERNRCRMPDGSRMSQLDLANETGVGMRTIGRIEKGEGENSPSIETLEAYFGIGDSSVATDQGSPPDTPPTIEQYTLMELLAEAVRRVAQMEARTGERATDTGRRVKWSTSDAPSSRRPEGPGQPGHGVHGVQ